MESKTAITATSPKFTSVESLKDYTYSDRWVDRLVAAVNDDSEFATIKAIRL